MGREGKEGRVRGRETPSWIGKVKRWQPYLRLAVIIFKKHKITFTSACIKRVLRCLLFKCSRNAAVRDNFSVNTKTLKK